jgi:uncharacterized SAM-binding protein YcdF (DUF218 family)
MFFFVSKLFFAFARPLHFLLLLMLVGLVLQMARARRIGIWLINIAIVALLAIAFGPLAPFVERPLETRFPRPGTLDPAPDGIIILGGALNPDLGASRPDYYSTDDGSERLTEVPRLARLYPNARIIYTGGPSAALPGALNEAQAARKLLIDLGVPADRITLEEHSLTTWENAVMTRAIINPAPDSHWLLVTSAFHIPRSVGTFRKAGWPGIIAYPTDYRLPDPRYGLPFRRAAIENLDLFETAAKEWYGLLGYWLGGRSSDLFPAP